MVHWFLGIGLLVAQIVVICKGFDFFDHLGILFFQRWTAIQRVITATRERRKGAERSYLEKKENYRPTLDKLRKWKKRKRNDSSQMAETQERAY